jgi:hypothetical protein
MSERTIISCDRCGRRHGGPLGLPDPGAVELSPFGGPFWGKLHLCRDCARALRAWLERGPQPDDPRRARAADQPPGDVVGRTRRGRAGVRSR